MATAAFAVEDSLTPNATAAVRVDMEIAALLAKVEQQISDGSIIAPYDDNAQKTWQVVEMQATTPASPGARMALSLFAEHWRNRAVNEEKAGRLAIATYLKVFSEFATDLLGRTREPSAASAPQGTTLRPFAEGLTAPGTSIELAAHSTWRYTNPRRFDQSTTPTRPGNCANRQARHGESRSAYRRTRRAKCTYRYPCARSECDTCDSRGRLASGGGSCGNGLASSHGRADCVGAVDGRSVCQARR